MERLVNEESAWLGTPAQAIPDWLSALREKAQATVRASPLWDGPVFALQVTDAHEMTMAIRILASAANAGRAFDQRCLIREERVAMLVENDPGALPRSRTKMEGCQALNHALSQHDNPKRGQE